MAATTTERIPKFSFREPLLNLQKHVPSKMAESIFTLQFARAYLAQYKNLHHGSSKLRIAYSREIPINGFGIADFVAVSWDELKLPGACQRFTPDIFIKLAEPTIRAFESKLKDWRRAMMQANRYKYFSNVVIVVMPADKCSKPLEYLNVFRAINVGLWGFDTDSNRIIPHFTPRSRAAMDIRYEQRALKLVARASKVLPIF